LEKLTALSNFIFNTANQNLNIFLFLIFITLSIYLVIKFRQQTKNIIFITSFLFLSLTVLFFILPFTIQSHYVFALIGLLFTLVASLPQRLSFLLISIFSLIYLNPQLLKIYFAPAPRTYSQTDACIKNYCQQFQNTTFVSVNSSYHPWHNGPEFRYLLKKNNCQIKDVETQNGQADYMTVILDNSTFDTNTKYYELDLFGKYQTISQFNCLPNFQIQTLKKI